MLPTWATSLLSGLMNLPSAIAAVVNAWMQRDKELNSPEMVANAEAKKMQDLKDRANKDLREGNKEDLEKLEAE